MNSKVPFNSLIIITVVFSGKRLWIQIPLRQISVKSRPNIRSQCRRNYKNTIKFLIILKQDIKSIMQDSNTLKNSNIQNSKLKVYIYSYEF